MIRRINPNTIAAPAPRYSHGIAVPAGMRMLVLSGQVGAPPVGKIPPTVEEQLEVIWTNIGAILADDGMTFANVISVRGFLVSRDGLAAYRSAYSARLIDVKPASTLVIVKELVAPELLAEIEVVAAA